MSVFYLSIECSVLVDDDVGENDTVFQVFYPYRHYHHHHHHHHHQVNLRCCTSNDAQEPLSLQLGVPLSL